MLRWQDNEYISTLKKFFFTIVIHLKGKSQHNNINYYFRIIDILDCVGCGLPHQGEYLWLPWKQKDTIPSNHHGFAKIDCTSKKDP